MDGVVCRRAQAEDYQGVMDIGEAYDGIDYLPHMYHKYLKDPMVYSYVTEKDGEIVAYRFQLIVDHGRTIIGGGARTKPAHRNGNYQFRMVGLALKEMAPVLEKYGPTNQFLYTTWEHEQSIKTIEKRGLSIIHRRGTTGYSSNSEEISLLAKKLKSRFLQQEIIQLSGNEIEETLLNPKNKQHLFQENRIVVFWETYEVTEENLSYILREYNTVFFAVTSGTQCSSVACFTTLPTSYGLRCDFEYYGDSFDEWISLFVQGLQYLSSLSYQGKVCIPMFFPAHWEDGPLKGWLKENCGWEVGPWDWTQYKYQITVRMPLIMPLTDNLTQANL